METRSARTRSPEKVIADAMALFKSIDPNIQVNQIQMFLEVCRREGSQMGAIAEHVDEPHSTSQRIFSGLSHYGTKKKPGYGLINILQDPEDRRQRLVYLSQSGKSLRDQLKELFGHGID